MTIRHTEDMWMIATWFGHMEGGMDDFFNHLNNQSDSIKSTMEVEDFCNLAIILFGAFLDVLETK